jgi:hypothetical protein
MSPARSAVIISGQILCCDFELLIEKLVYLIEESIGVVK